MRSSRNSPCPCGSGIKFKKCCINNGLNPASTANLYSVANQIIPTALGLPEENSSQFQALEDWANTYLSSINPEHPLFFPLSDHLITHGQLIDLAAQLNIHDYLAVAAPLYEAWKNA